MSDYGVRSDALKQLRSFYDVGAPLAPLTSVFQLNLIVDANVVLAELRWAVSKRKSETARSELLEVLEVETVIAYAPTFLKTEVELHISQTLVGEQGLDAAALIAHWNRIHPLIEFVEVGGPVYEAGHLDPKDVPYLRLQERIAAHILSRDKHISKMGGTVAPMSILGSLRQYSRASAVQLSLEVGGATIGAVSLTALAEIARTTFSATRAVGSKLPREAWMFALALVCLLLALPSSRKTIVQAAGKLASGLKSTSSAVASVAEYAATRYQARRNITNEALAVVNDTLLKLPKVGVSLSGTGNSVSPNEKT
jgi:predicted nucleic acid-binding protein